MSKEFWPELVENNFPIDDNFDISTPQGENEFQIHLSPIGRIYVWDYHAAESDIERYDVLVRCPRLAEVIVPIFCLTARKARNSTTLMNVTDEMWAAWEEAAGERYEIRRRE